MSIPVKHVEHTRGPVGFPLDMVDQGGGIQLSWEERVKSGSNYAAIEKEIGGLSAFSDAHQSAIKLSSSCTDFFFAVELLFTQAWWTLIRHVFDNICMMSMSDCIWHVPWGHGFNFHPGNQGVCSSILLEPSGVGGSLGYHVYEYRFDFIDLINFTLRSPPLFGLGSVMHLACNTACVST